MKLYVVRHGETLFNVKHLVQGICDSPLTEKGIEKADRLGEILKEIPFVAAYCSTLKRTEDTAIHIIGNRDISLKRLDGLKEYSFGSFEGDPEGDVMNGDALQKGFKAYGGDDMESTGTRAYETWLSICQKHPEGNVLAVTHGGALICGGLKVDQEKVMVQLSKAVPPANCSVTILNYENGRLSMDSWAEDIAK